MTRTIGTVFVALTLLLASQIGALGAQGTVVKIEEKSYLAATPFFGGAITVVLQVDGTGGCNAFVQVSQTGSTGSTFGNGNRFFVGTGQRDEIAVTVTSFGAPFNVGRAQALAQVFCFEGPAADDRTINIVP